MLNTHYFCSPYQYILHSVTFDVKCIMYTTIVDSKNINGLEDTRYACPLEFEYLLQIDCEAN